MQGELGLSENGIRAAFLLSEAWNDVVLSYSPTVLKNGIHVYLNTCKMGWEDFHFEQKLGRQAER